MHGEALQVRTIEVIRFRPRRIAFGVSLAYANCRVLWPIEAAHIVPRSEAREQMRRQRQPHGGARALPA